MISLIACNKNNEVSNLAVERYVSLLKANQYDSVSLPAFTYSDIPALLKYRNETHIITNFPYNGLSSLYAPNCTLEMYVLWRVESIRAVSINTEYLVGRFPSQNPILAYRDSVYMKLVFDDASHKLAAQAYYDWWKNNKQKDFSEFKSVDPLATTKYKWH